MLISDFCPLCSWVTGISKAEGRVFLSRNKNWKRTLFWFMWLCNTDTFIVLCCRTSPFLLPAHRRDQRVLKNTTGRWSQIRYHIVLIVVTKCNLNGKMTNLNCDVPNLQIQGCWRACKYHNFFLLFLLFSAILCWPHYWMLGLDEVFGVDLSPVGWGAAL